MPGPFALWSLETFSPSHDIYTTMAFISFSVALIASPFQLRSKQSFTGLDIVSL